MTKVDLAECVSIKRTIQPMGKLVTISGRPHLCEQMGWQWPEFVLQDVDKGLALGCNHSFGGCIYWLGGLAQRNLQLLHEYF